MIITLDGAGRPLATIDLGDASTHGHFDEGDLSATCGNLYVNVDGVEYGSLFFFQQPDGTLNITLGAFDIEQQEWVKSATLNNPVEA